MRLAALSLVLAAIAAPVGGGPRPGLSVWPGEPEIPAVTGVRSALWRAGLTGQITVEDRRAWLEDLGTAQRTVGRLTGARQAELGAVLGTLSEQAATGRLTASRMPLAFLTLRRNTQQWRFGAFPATGERRTFGADPAIFQYFPGQGVQFHPLATAGRASALAPACMRAADAHERAVQARAAAAQARAEAAAAAAASRAMERRTGGDAALLAPPAARDDVHRTPSGRGTTTAVDAAGRTGRDGVHRAAPPRGRNDAVGFGCRKATLRRLLDTLTRLASRRDGFVAWEYDFSFAGSAPLWISAMTQATAAQALARGADALGEPAYRETALGALAAFETPPPLGVALPGSEYAMYSFNPGLHILNGFLQSVIGLHDVADLTRSPLAARLYASGERTARRSVAAFDTGAWSRYSLGGAESTLSYHQLVTGFLGGLCRRTALETYCATEKRFARYEREPPRIRLEQSRRGREDRPTALRFSLSKVSDVVVRVSGRRPILHETLHLPRGAGYRFAWTPPRGGTYAVKVAAVGPEGLRGVARTTVRVKATPKPKPKPKPRKRGSRRRAG